MPRAIEQLELIVEELETSLAASPAPPNTTPASSPRTTPVRRAAAGASAAGDAWSTRRRAPALTAAAALQQIGEDVAEHTGVHSRALQGDPPCAAEARVRQVLRRIVQAAGAVRPIDAGMAGPGLLAHVAVSQVLPIICRCTGKPQIYAREGVELERSTLADWVGGIGAPGDAAGGGRSVATSWPPTKLHADDTPVPVLDPGRGKTKTGRLVDVRARRSPGGQHRGAGGVVSAIRRTARGERTRGRT